MGVEVVIVGITLAGVVAFWFTIELLEEVASIVDEKFTRLLDKSLFSVSRLLFPPGAE